MVFKALINNLEHIKEQKECLHRLSDIVGRPTDLTFSQWLSWYATALQFNPDLIIELGRGYGNSTCLFTHAANFMEDTKVHSLCFSNSWDELTLPKLKKVVSEEWLQHLAVYREDILKFDFERVIGDHKRVLLIWDAHGFKIAEIVLGKIMPLFVNRDHLVLCHDISDNRYGGDRSYQGKRLWTGMETYWGKGSPLPNQGETAYLNVSWVNTVVDQALPILDFCFRNYIELHSADHEYQTGILKNPELLNQLSEIELNKSSSFGYAYFSLNEGKSPYTFPALIKDVA